MKRIVFLYLLLFAEFNASAQLIIDSARIFHQAPFKSCHASTIVETQQGDLLVAFFGGSWEGCNDVGIWSCRKTANSNEWSAPQQIANGHQPDSTMHPCWNPVLYKLPGRANNLVLFYKTGILIPDWRGYMMRSDDGGLTWKAPEALPEGFLGAIKNKPTRYKGHLVCPSSCEKDHWHVHFELCNKRARQWRKVMLQTGDSIRSIQPTILTHSNGTLQALCRTKEGYLSTTYSHDGGKSWSVEHLTNIPHNNSGIDALTASNGRFYMVYNPVPLTSPTSEFGPRYPLVLATSTDGLNWTTIQTLESQPGEYSYPSIIEGHDHTLHVVYTWNRTHIKYVRLKIME